MTLARPSAGFSLPEATLALGLIAGVLISLSGLFVQADRMMRGGKYQTEALTVARNVLEDTGAWHFRDLYGRFGLDGSAARYTIDTRTHAEAAAWQAGLERDVPSSHAEILLESVVASGPAPPLASARAIRVTVVVHWRQGAVSHSLRVATVRM